MDLAAIQSELRRRGINAWLFYDHHQRDPIAYRILGLAPGHATRRWYYLIPAAGAPRKLVHRIESAALDALPGETRGYARWDELDQGMHWLVAALGDAPTVAMQYSPAAALPAISLADAGTVEQVRALGCTVVSSGDLISRFDAAWTPAMLATHRAAGRAVDATIAAAFAHVRACLDAQRPLTEYGLQRWIVDRLTAAGCALEDPPIVAVDAHAADPHYSPQPAGSADITPGNLLLLDVWARTAEPGSAFYDVTWVGYCLRPEEREVPPQFEAVFACARDARDAGVALVQAAVAAGRPLRGCDVDRAVRAVIESRGFGPWFVHRTGHSLGRDVHAAGPNMDDYETHDERLILPHSGFTIEPGIYGPHQSPFGVRTEINVYVGDTAAEVTGPSQTEIVRI